MSKLTPGNAAAVGVPAWRAYLPLAALAIFILAVLPLCLDLFRLNLVGKYLTYAFVAVGLVLPAVVKPLGKLAAVAAAALVAEMVLFSGLHLASDVAAHGEMIYWLVVAAFALFVAAGRWKLLAAKLA